MHRVIIQLLITICALGGFNHTSRACSTFLLVNGGRPVFGRNYDWHFDGGLLVENKRKVDKTALTWNKAAKWTSEYGSVTFNQYGRELPCGGMNEAGLVVEVMWLDDTVYPRPDERPTVSTLQWVQYQLDTAATVADVVANDKRVRIQPLSGSRIHYLVADAKGNCATIEFLDGKMAVHTGADLPVPVLTNSTYEHSQATLKDYEGFGGKAAVRPHNAGGSRFVCAASMVKKYDSHGDKPAVPYAFEVLDSISQGDFTKWQIVYNIANRQIHFRTHRVRSERVVKFPELDFSTETPVRVLDLNAKHAGIITRDLVQYTRQANRRLIASCFEETPMLRHMPAALVEVLARYPETCKPPENVADLQVDPLPSEQDKVK